MPQSFREFVDKIRLTADILDVVGRHVELKRAGSRWKGNCPFHQEKTPSFFVSPERQSYYCFGCHAHGDAIEFTMKIENLDWREAAEQLGRSLGLEPPQRSSMAEDEKERKFRESLLAANAMAQEFFAKNLLESLHGKDARKYLAGRQIDEATIRNFGIGLSMDSWDSLAQHGARKGFSEDILLSAGLLIKNEEKNRVYDRFRGRIMFPIFDSMGRPIGFGGRVFGPQAREDEAKYINSPETPLYHKGHQLYAYHLARDPIKNRKCAVVLEGYTDVIALHRHGFDHAVASLGTALTNDQARLLRRLCRDVIFLYDDDEPGRKAMLRGTEILLANEFTIRCVGLKEGEDPDSYLRTHGPDAFAERLSQAKPFFEHFLGLALHKFDKSTVSGRTAVVETLGPLIKATPNVIEADEYLQHLAETLSLAPDVVRAHLKIGARKSDKSDKSDRSDQSETPPDPSFASAPHQAELALLRILIDHPEAAGRIERFNSDWIEQPVVRQLVDKALAAAAKGELDWQRLINEATDAEKQVFRNVALLEAQIGDPDGMLLQTCRRLEIRRGRRMARSMSKQLSSASLDSLEDTDRQLREIHRIHQQRHEAGQEIRHLRNDEEGA